MRAEFFFFFGLGKLKSINKVNRLQFQSLGKVDAVHRLSLLCALSLSLSLSLSLMLASILSDQIICICPLLQIIVELAAVRAQQPIHTIYSSENDG